MDQDHQGDGDREQAERPPGPADRLGFGSSAQSSDGGDQARQTARRDHQLLGVVGVLDEQDYPEAAADDQNRPAELVAEPSERIAQQVLARIRRPAPDAFKDLTEAIERASHQPILTSVNNELEGSAVNFQVNPDTIANYGGLVERNGINFSLVNVHLAQNTKLGSTTGWWLSTLVTAHDETVSRMLDSIYKGFHTMGDSSGELTRTADYYRNTDRGAAAKLDSTYPASPRPPVDPVPGAGHQQGPGLGHEGTDVADPLQFLKSPGQPQEFTDPIKFFNVVSDLLSPSWWINQVLSDTIGCNPLKFATDHIAGDWEGFARCAFVWEDLSHASGAIGDNVKSGLSWLAADWQGRAADTAVNYFDYTYKALDSHREVLHRLHEKYLEIARGVWNCARTVADVLKGILDNLIIAGIAVLAAWFLSWTGVGAGISLAVAAVECANILKLWNKMTGLISNTQKSIEGFVGFLQSQEAHVLNEIRPLPMPATDYQHPNPEIAPARPGPPRRGETL